MNLAPLVHQRGLSSIDLERGLLMPQRLDDDSDAAASASDAESEPWASILFDPFGALLDHWADPVDITVSGSERAIVHVASNLCCIPLLSFLHVDPIQDDGRMKYGGRKLRVSGVVRFEKEEPAEENPEENPEEGDADSAPEGASE
jgi:hypothetical protein